MSSPQTLLQIAGAQATPCSLSNSALVLIDMQNEYLPTGKVPLKNVEQALDKGKELLEKARQNKTPVIHVVHHGTPGAGFYDPLGEGGKLNEKVAPVEGEPVVTKSFANSFTQTNLDELLEKTGKKELIVAGFMSHVCVNSTVRAASEKGYKVTVVASATATRDLPSGTTPGKVTPAEVLQESSIAALQDFFATIVNDPAELK